MQPPPLPVSHRTSASAEKQEAGAAVLFLAAIPCVAIGIFVGVVGCVRYVAYYGTASWIPTPATLQRVELEMYGPPAPKRDGACRVQYTYRFGNHDYVGQALTIDPEPMRDYQAETQYQSLMPMVNGPVTVWVDPRAPSRSALLRTATSPWVGFFFGAIGSFAMAGGAVAMGVYRLRAARPQNDQSTGGKGNKPGR